jgi:hypothetical protein
MTTASHSTFRTPQQHAHRQTALRHLRELIRALDTRIPQGERAGEGAIMRDAAALRTMAVQRIAVLEGETLDD